MLPAGVLAELAQADVAQAEEKQAAKAMHAATERVEEHLRRGVFIPLTFANEKDPPKSPAQRQQQEMPLMSYI